MLKPPPTLFSIHQRDVLRQLSQSGERWAEFFDTGSLSMGLYTVPAGGDDRETHSPHEYDEVYYTVAGTGELHVEGETTDVTTGSIHFVRAGAGHYFTAREELTLFVVFAKGG